jgi:hypothetical protein
VPIIGFIWISSPTFNKKIFKKIKFFLNILFYVLIFTILSFFLFAYFALENHSNEVSTISPSKQYKFTIDETCTFHCFVGTKLYDLTKNITKNCYNQKISPMLASVGVKLKGSV